MAISLSNLRTVCRQRADQENSTFITDSELNDYINSSIAELYDLLIQSYGSDYLVSSTTFTTVTGTDEYDLPTDFYKLRGVDAQLGSGNDFLTLRPFNFNERNRFTDVAAWTHLGAPAVRYHLIGSKIKFSPIPDRNATIKLWYIPTAPKLEFNSDELDQFNGYDEYVIVDVVIKMKLKEESDTTVEERQKAALKQRIEEASQNRDAAQPESVSDIHAENFDFFYWGFRGN